MKIYLVCKNNPPDWNATRVEVEDVVVKAYTTETKAEEVRDTLVYNDWLDVNKHGIEHNARIESIIDQLSDMVPEHYMEEVLKIAGFKRAPVLPKEKFRVGYFIHELEVEE